MEKRDEHQNQAKMKKQIDGLKHELKQLETILAALTICKNKRPNLYWTTDQSTSQADLCLSLRMFSPDSGLFTRHKNEQGKIVEEQLLNILSKAAVDAKEEQFMWCHAALQEQLEEAQRAALPDEDEDQGQDPEPASRVDEEEGQDPELAGASMNDLAGKNDDAGNNSY